MNKNELTDERIGALIDQKCKAATSWYSSKLSTERQEVTDYINRKLPKPQHAGSASFVTSHVYNAVQMMQAQLAETFSAGSGIVQFDARNGSDRETARIATDYANFVFYKQNNGERIIRDAIYDGLTARVGVAKVWWEKDYDDVEFVFENATAEELEAWDKTEDVISFEAEEDQLGTFAGKLVRRIHKGQVKVDVVNPEEFSIEKNARSLSDEYFCVHRTERTIDWIVSNYPDMKGREEELRGGFEDDLSMSPERLARFRDVDDGIRSSFDDDDQDELRQVMVYEAYAKFQKKGDLTARLYKVLRCGKVNIEIEPCEELPFVVFTPISRPHLFYGENFARTVIPTQIAQTVAFRAILDNAAQSANQRWLVAKGSGVNPRELLENRLSGIVNVQSLANSVAPLPTGQINPQLFSLMQGLDAMNEQVTGITALSQGLNKDAISTQNSAGLMEQQLGVSQTRQKEIARNFADQFLVPLFCKIYDLVVRFERREDIAIVTGSQWVPIQPWAWSEGRTASASAHLGYGEKQSKAQELMMLGEKLASNPMTAQFAGPEGAYKMAARVFTLLGYRSDIPDFLPVTPDQIKPPQPDPLDVAKAQALTTEAQAKMLTASALAQKVKQHESLTSQKMSMNAAEADLNLDLRRRDAARKDMEAQSRVTTSQIETALLVTAAEDQGTEQAKAIISPNS